MLIVCPSCATSYDVGPAALGAAGRSVRCAHCKKTWFATPGEALATAAAEAAAERLAAPPARPKLVRIEPAALAGDRHAAAPPEPAHAEIMPAEAPPLAPQHLPEAPQLAKLEVPQATESVETVAARRTRRLQAERKDRKSLLRRLVSAPMLIFALLAVLTALINWRDKVVRYAPQTASLFATIGMPVTPRGLVFDHVTPRTEMSDGLPVLIVEGTIVNVTTRQLEVPRLRFALRNAAGHEVYAWTSPPPKATVGSGNGLAFRTRLASPPPDGRDVIVRFFNRRDVTAGLQ